MSSADEPQVPARGDFTIEPLYTLPAGSRVQAMTPDGHSMALLDCEDGRLRACWDSLVGDPFEGFVELRDGSLAITVSDDGEHVAYVGDRDEGFFVVRDGREDPPFLDFTRSVPPVLSPGGTHLAYGVGAESSPDSLWSDEPDFRLILDGHAVNEWPLAPIQVVFSPSGERLAFVEIRDRHEFRIVIDGVPGPWFIGLRNAAGAMQFSPDGRRFAYYRIDGSGRAQWVVDGQAQQWTADVRPFGLASPGRIGVVEPRLFACFSPDSRTRSVARSTIRTGSPMSSTKVSPLLTITAACMIN